jgi:hypothetical protein
VIQHIVLLKWHAGTTDAQVGDVLAQAEELVRGIDGVEQVTLGRNRGSGLCRSLPRFQVGSGYPPDSLVSVL